MMDVLTVDEVQCLFTEWRLSRRSDAFIERCMEALKQATIKNEGGEGSVQTGNDQGNPERG